MPASVFLAPCDPGDFERTVQTEVQVADYDDVPGEIADQASVRFWGARDGTRNRQFFEKMASGDVVLFYHDGDYVGVATIDTTFEDTDGWARETVWQNAPAHLIYTLRDVSPVAVPRHAVNALFDYDPDHAPQGLIRVSDRRYSSSVHAIKRAVEKYDQKHN